MRLQVNNHLASLAICSIIIVMGCTKESLVSDVSPDRLAVDVASDPAEDAAPEAFYRSDDGTFVQLTSRINLGTMLVSSISKVPFEGPEFAKRDDEDPEVAALTSNQLYAYSVGGAGSMTHSILGEISVAFRLSTDPFKGTSEGTITIQSMSERSSTIAIAIQGPDEMGSISSEGGYAFSANVTMANGSFASYDYTGIGTLTVDPDASVELRGVQYVRLSLALFE